MFFCQSSTHGDVLPQTKFEKATDKNLQGEGTRLGTAYRLKDEKGIYVPEGYE